MAFTGSLDVRRLQGDKWEILTPYRYYLLDTGEYCEIHKGFVTDLASIPFPFSRVFLPMGKSYDWASVTHDFLYWLPYVWSDLQTCRKIGRWEADRVYLQAMEESKTPWFVRRSLYAGVRCGGGWPWAKYREMENANIVR